MGNALAKTLSYQNGSASGTVRRRSLLVAASNDLNAVDLFEESLRRAIWAETKNSVEVYPQLILNYREMSPYAIAGAAAYGRERTITALEQGVGSVFIYGHGHTSAYPTLGNQEILDSQTWPYYPVLMNASSYGGAMLDEYRWKTVTEYALQEFSDKGFAAIVSCTASDATDTPYVMPKYAALASRIGEHYGGAIDQTLSPYYGYGNLVRISEIEALSPNEPEGYKNLLAYEMSGDPSVVSRLFDDFDDDGMPDESDNCPSLYNRSEPPVEWRDSDGDGVGDDCDDCPGHSDASQSDRDWNSLGDMCQPSQSCSGALHEDFEGTGAGHFTPVGVDPVFWIPNVNEQVLVSDGKATVLNGDNDFCLRGEDGFCRGRTYRVVGWARRTAPSDVVGVLCEVHSGDLGLAVPVCQEFNVEEEWTSFALRVETNEGTTGIFFGARGGEYVPQAVVSEVWPAYELDEVVLVEEDHL
jgi:hypothetical protein